MMSSRSAQQSFLDVEQYPSDFLQKVNNSVHVPVTYRRLWDDGFGARGWKVNATIGDPEIIASTRETGQRIATSVFVHDILDHFLSGFGVSGHRSEAMALIQLLKRTGSDPEPDYEQLIREDILRGRVNGESLSEFLPAELYSMIPDDSEMTDKDVIEYLLDRLGEKLLTRYLVNHFFALGVAGEAHAAESWQKLGMDTRKRTETGQALQTLLAMIDKAVEEHAVEELHGIIGISRSHVFFKAEPAGLIKQYEVEIA